MHCVIVSKSVLQVFVPGSFSSPRLLLDLFSSVAAGGLEQHQGSTSLSANRAEGKADVPGKKKFANVFVFPFVVDLIFSPLLLFGFGWKQWRVEDEHFGCRI